MKADGPQALPSEEAPAGEAETIEADICIIGGGAAGLSLAAAATAFGRRVVLIERHKMGGNHLNYGCVPSKALLAAAKRAHAARTAAKFGVTATELQINPRALYDHVQGVVAEVAPNDSGERFTGLGARVMLSAARFIDKMTVMAGERRIKARRYVIATGSSPAVPEIPGIENVAYFTNETIFEYKERLHDLIVLGAGPVALELAQAYARLGSRVTVLAAEAPLADEDPELAHVVLDRLAEEGVNLATGVAIERIEGGLERVRVHLTAGGKVEVVEGTHLLVASGRRPTIADLGLEVAGIRYDENGIKVNSSFKTSNRRVFAIGDVIGAPYSTPLAEQQALAVLRRILFWRPTRVEARLIPRVMYTDPELAQVGLSEAEARAAGKIDVLRWPYHENDRAHAEGETAGHVKVVCAKNGRILGAAMVGAQAGELIQMWALAIAKKLTIKDMAGWIPPYPTLGEINKRAAARYYALAPASPRVRKIIGFLARFG